VHVERVLLVSPIPNVEVLRSMKIGQ